MDKCLFISKNAISYNVNYYLEKTNKKFIAVIKNNAYGHGIKEMVSILEKEDVSMYAVSNIKEAREVSCYSSKDILILDKVDGSELIEENMVITVISIKHLKELIRTNKEFRIHLKINCLMKRKGINANEIAECLSLINKSKLKLEGIYTHYSTYKIKSLKKQFLMFKKAIERVDTTNLIVHASSSISALLLKEDDTTHIRIGVGMYGLKKLNKVMSPLEISSELKCKIQTIYPIKCFNKFSYHSTYFGKKGYVVMINLGYGDGLFYKNRIKGYLDGIYLKEIGVRNIIDK